jgi:hypothetical protein
MKVSMVMDAMKSVCIHIVPDMVAAQIAMEHASVMRGGQALAVILVAHLGKIAVVLENSPPSPPPPIPPSSPPLLLPSSPLPLPVVTLPLTHKTATLSRYLESQGTQSTARRVIAVDHVVVKGLNAVQPLVMV